MNILIHDYAGHPFAYDLSLELAKKKNRIYHFFFKNDVGPKGYSFTKKNLEVVPISIRNYKKENFFSRFFLDFVYGFKFISKLSKIDCNVVISNAPINTQFLIYIYCKLTNKKFIFWLQDIYFISVKYLIKNKFFNVVTLTFFKIIEKNILRNSDFIIVNSKSFKNTLRKYNILNKNISIIENWPPKIINSKIPKMNNWSKKLIKNNKKKIFYTGTLALKHNPKLIYDLAKKSTKDFDFYIFSSGTGFENLKILQKKNYLNNLILKPLVPIKLYSKVLASADFFLGTINNYSREFAIPSKIYSYIAAKRPIIFISSTQNSQAKLIRKYELGISISINNNINNICKIIKNFSTNTSHHKKILINQIKYEKQNFRIDLIAKKFSKIINT